MNLPTTTKPAATSKPNNPPTSECGNCGSHNSWTLHHVRLRGIHRRLCTSCVLRLHPSSFCPSCFSFYDSSPPPPSKRLSCSNCSSFTHSQCAPSSPSSPYLCPPCASPNFSFFHITDRSLDKNLALVLLCAAKIAAASMAKAVIVARADAERRVREAAVARKRAREALEHVAFLSNRDNPRPKEASAQVSGSGNVGLKDKDKISLDRNSEKLDKNSFPVEKEALDGFTVQNAVQGTPQNLGSVEGGDGVRQNMGMGCALLNNNGNGAVNEKEKSGNSARLQNDNGEIQHLQNNHVKEENVASI